MNLGYVSTEEQEIYHELFANKIPYKERPVKGHLPLVAKLGIMDKAGKIEAIPGSINFSRDIDASRPSLATMYKKPATWARDSEIETTAVPKEARSNRLEYDFDKVFTSYGKGAYNNEELRFWYTRLTGIEVPRNVNRARLEELHSDLDINRGKR